MTIFLIFITISIILIIGYVIYTIKEREKDILEKTKIDDQSDFYNTWNLIDGTENRPKIEKIIEIENPKLQLAIEEGTKERYEKRKLEIQEENDKIEREKQRLLQDDLIYNMIKEAIVNGESSIKVKFSNYVITKKALRLIPGLKVMSNIIGRDRFDYNNPHLFQRDEWIRVYF